MLNTILTGIIVRGKEFALMRTVGMSQKQLSFMVRLEGLIIVAVGLMLSLVIGSGVGYILCSFLKKALMTYLIYRFPLGVTVIYSFVILLYTLAVTEVALKQQNKSSLIESLRN